MKTKKNHLFVKSLSIRALLLTVGMLLCTAMAWAANEPYAVLSDDIQTLTFYYDNQKAARYGMDIGPFSSASDRGWDAILSNIETVVFDESFAGYTDLTSTRYWFNDCSALTTITGITNLNTAKVTDMSYMFSGCYSLTSLDVSSFNTAKVENMSYMFAGCSGLLYLDVSTLNTVSVENMEWMFQGCSNLSSLNVSKFNTANVTDMGAMFRECSTLTDLDVSKFNTDKVTDMGGMFRECSILISLDVRNFNTAKVNQMQEMFYGCTGLKTIYCNDTWSCSSSSDMFYGCTSLKGAISYGPGKTDVTYANPTTGYFTSTLPKPYAALSNGNTFLTFYYDTEKVARNGMDIGPFSSASDRGWNVKCTSITTVVFDGSFAAYTGLTSTANWFYDCSGLTTISGIANLKTANVTDMSNMFKGCSSLTSLDVSKLNTANVTDMGGMFRECTGLTELDLSNFDTSNVTSMTEMFYNCSSLTTIYCDGTWSCSSSSDMFLGCTSLKGAIAYDPGKTDVTYANPTTGYFTSALPKPYAALSNANTVLTFYYDTKKTTRNGMDIGPFSNSLYRGWDSECSKITTVVFDESFASYTDLTSTCYWFSDCSALATITGMANLNTANVTNMSYMFYGCSGLTSLDVSKFNTGKVKNMSNMFTGCSGLTSLDVSTFNTAKVVIMSYMFTGCSGLKSLNVSTLNTVSVEDMKWMFKGCSNLTSLDVSHFNTASVEDMGFMFYDCSKLTSLDVSNFDIGKVTSMSNMFNDCSSLVTIYGDEPWSCSDSYNMFMGCTSLKGAISYNSNKTDVTYANPTTGYFTPTGKAHLRPYAVLSADNKTLTFYYDTNKTSRNGMNIWLFNNSSDRGWDAKCSKITTVVFDGSFAGCTEMTSTAYWFDGCSALTTITGMANLNTANVTNMSYMFYQCSGLTSLDVSKFNTAKVTNMGAMFRECSGLTSLDVSKFNTAKVTEMGAMFRECSGLTELNLSNFDTSNVTNMAWMFYNCSSLTTIYCYDTWSCSSSSQMFYGCTALKGAVAYNPIQTDVAYANPTTGYFTNAIPRPYAVLSADNKTLTFYYDGNKDFCNGMDIGPFSKASDRGWSDQAASITTVVFDESFADYTELTSTAYWFSDCSVLATITGIEYLHTDKVTDMMSMFQGCSGLKDIDLSHFNTANVTSMYRLFQNCSGLTSLDVSKFNTANLTDMNSMFKNCSGLTELDVNNFDTGKVMEMDDMFRGCSNLTIIYCSNTWSCSSSSNMFLGCTSLMGAIAYDAEKTDVTYANPTTGYFSIRLPYAVLSDDDKTLTFYYDGYKNLRSGMDVGPFDGSNNRGWHAQCESITTVVFDESFADYTELTSTAHWFRDCKALTTVTGIEYLHTDNVTRMNRMFYGCNALTSLDVSHFNTAKVTEMVQMFFNCSSLTSLDVRNFNTANVTDMSFMFRGCSSLTSLDVNNFNTDKVTDMSYMFSGCSSLETIYCNNTWSGSSSTSMFAGCTSLRGAIMYNEGMVDVTYANPETGYFTSNLPKPYASLSDDNKTLTFYYDEKKFSRGGMDVGPFILSTDRGWDAQIAGITTVVFDKSFADYTELTSTAYWFDNCSALATILGIENLHTDNVTDMYRMFYGCSSLTSLDLRNFNTAKVTEMERMFRGCSSLTTIYCNDTWSCSHSENMFFNCTSLVGAIAYDENKVDVTYANPVTGYFTNTIPMPYAALSDDNKTLTFYYDENKYSRKGMDVGPFSGGSDRGWTDQRTIITTVVFDKSFDDYKELTSTAYWFNDCSALTAVTGIEYLHTDNVKDMYRMFNGCSSLTELDVRYFNTAKVNQMQEMFYGCTSLKTIYGNDTWSCSNSSDMFYDCTSLVGVIPYESEKTDVTWANPDTGYFTRKATFIKGDANGDGVVTITDAVAVVNKILGNASENFNESAADVNGDGVITITDAVGIVNIILNGGE